MPALTIAIDASRTTAARRTGTENYALQLIRAMIALETAHRYTLYFRDPPPAGLFPERTHVTQRVIPWARAWTHMRWAWTLWRDRPDVSFVPAHTLPLWFPGRAVVTVHDLGYVYFPGTHPPLARRYLDWSTRHSIRRATHIIADSLATARDIAAHYGIAEAKISRVYPGADEALMPVTDTATHTALRTRYNLPNRYLLFVGTLQPRKNIARIVQGYDRWRAAHPDSDIALVLAGQPGWLYDPRWVENVMGVIMPGYVDDDDRAALYSGAVALVFPTLYEGFGFPVLEAMRCGTPVITSSTSSLPEVAGNAAVLVNPRDVAAIARAIERIVTDTALRAELITAGQRQTQRFTWQQAAEQTLAILETAAQAQS